MLCMSKCKQFHLLNNCKTHFSLLGFYRKYKSRFLLDILFIDINCKEPFRTYTMLKLHLAISQHLNSYDLLIIVFFYIVVYKYKKHDTLEPVFGIIINKFDNIFFYLFVQLYSAHCSLLSSAACIIRILFIVFYNENYEKKNKLNCICTYEHMYAEDNIRTLVRCSFIERNLITIVCIYVYIYVAR